MEKGFGITEYFRNYCAIVYKFHFIFSSVFKMRFKQKKANFCKDVSIEITYGFLYKKYITLISHIDGKFFFVYRTNLSHKSILYSDTIVFEMTWNPGKVIVIDN